MYAALSPATYFKRCHPSRSCQTWSKHEEEDKVKSYMGKNSTLQLWRNLSSSSIHVGGSNYASCYVWTFYWPLPFSSPCTILSLLLLQVHVITLVSWASNHHPRERSAKVQFLTAGPSGYCGEPKAFSRPYFLLPETQLHQGRKWA